MKHSKGTRAAALAATVLAAGIVAAGPADAATAHTAAPRAAARITTQELRASIAKAASQEDKDAVLACGTTGIVVDTTKA